MSSPLVCMSLTGKTLEEDVQLAKKYADCVDVVELRVDYLNEDEQLYIKRFPSMVRVPCILTIRRDVDGGLYDGGEFSRTSLFGRALAFANTDRDKNFAYVEFEEDYHIPGIQDAAMAFGVRIIRSCYHYKYEDSSLSLKQKCDSMRKTGFEIPKVVYSVKSLSEVTHIFTEAQLFNDYDHIVSATGVYGFPTKVLAALNNSYLTYTFPTDNFDIAKEHGILNPSRLINVYGYRNISRNTDIYGLMTSKVENDAYLELFNKGFRKMGMNNVYIPVNASKVSEILKFAEQLNIKGLTVADSCKENVLNYLYDHSDEVISLGSSNLILKRNGKWVGYNTEASSFRSALEDFLGDTKLHRRKVAIIGAGISARVAAYVVKQMGGRACIFNKTLDHARLLAERYGFKYALLDATNAGILDEYSSLIIQTLPFEKKAIAPGEIVTEEQNKSEDPIYFYNFHGNEVFMDLNYTPAITPVMKRASLSGCQVTNGYKMLEYQLYSQFKLFTEKDLFL